MEELNISEWFHLVADQVDETKARHWDELFNILTDEFKHVSVLLKEAQDLEHRNICLYRMQRINQMMTLIVEKVNPITIKGKILEYLDYLKMVHGGNVTLITDKKN